MSKASNYRLNSIDRICSRSAVIRVGRLPIYPKAVTLIRTGVGNTVSIKP